MCMQRSSPFLSAKQSSKPSAKCTDVATLGKILPSQRKCCICSLPGHTKSRCIIQTYYGQFLNYEDICSLSITFNQISSYITEQRDEQKTVLSDLPSKYVAVVLMKRLFISTQVLPIHNSNNYCYECKVIGMKNTIISDNAVYNSRCIARLLSSITSNSMKKIICQMKISSVF